MKIQRYDTEDGDIYEGVYVEECDHEAKMQQSMRIIKKLRGERALWIKRCKQVSKHHPDTLILDE